MGDRLFLISTVLYVLTSTMPASAQDSTAKIWNGVYTAAQAERGKANFTTSCVRCHLPDLSGGTGPSLKGDRFMSAWENDNLYRLFTKIRDTMPPNFGTSLTEDAKLDVVTYILQANGFPEGSEDLKMNADELESVQIVRKGAETVVPNFALVRVIGCLTQGPDNLWMLTNANEPVVTKDQASTAEELKQAEAQTLGTGTFRLVSVSAFQPDLHNGHRMEAKGLLYREPNNARLNLTALQMVASSCARAN